MVDIMENKEKKFIVVFSIIEIGNEENNTSEIFQATESDLQKIVLELEKVLK